MRLEITQTAIKDMKRIKNSLQQAARDIKTTTDNKVAEVGTLGFNFAQNLAPEYTGALKQAMRLEFPTMNEFIIIASPSPSDRGFPLAIPFDTGQFGGMTMWGPGGVRIPFKPRGRGIGFMKETSLFLTKEFTERLGIAIHHNIEKIGSVM